MSRPLLDELLRTGDAVTLYEGDATAAIERLPVPNPRRIGRPRRRTGGRRRLVLAGLAISGGGLLMLSLGLCVAANLVGPFGGLSRTIAGFLMLAAMLLVIASAARYLWDIVQWLDETGYRDLVRAAQAGREPLGPHDLAETRWKGVVQLIIGDDDRPSYDAGWLRLGADEVTIDAGTLRLRLPRGCLFALVREAVGDWPLVTPDRGVGVELVASCDDGHPLTIRAAAMAARSVDLSPRRRLRTADELAEAIAAALVPTA